EAPAPDVADTAAAEAAEAAVRDVLARHGRIDVLVDNAGRTRVGALEETTEQELRDLSDVHVFGPARSPPPTAGRSSPWRACRRRSRTRPPSTGSRC
ncbi:SDR family NAD(P)-dependent oxidoreductase, partial [Streptomyces sp. SID625]|nr:SDR family NAD(P)-dependent oxidoreductase [Streptomyces sp. SID625]